jgi:catalase (peroxidase I)
MDETETVALVFSGGFGLGAYHQASSRELGHSEPSQTHSGGRT